MNTYYRLCQLIGDDSLWPELEQIAIQGVTDGSMAAMEFYRNAWKQQEQLTSDKNPSTLADLQATCVILKTCHASLHTIREHLGCGLSYLGEETVQYNDFLRDKLGDQILNTIHRRGRFFIRRDNMLRVIFDAIDGTENFNRGLPLFCSAIAILVDDQVRVSAIYDPIHHHVHSALLPGPYENPEQEAKAFFWEVGGNRIDMIEEAKKRQQKSLKEEVIGIHLTRSDDKKLEEFVAAPFGAQESVLERLCKKSRGIYALNSGLFAMKEVARGALGVFVNNFTRPWDVAAGEVLIRACGGKVTDFYGNPITYSSAERISVVAAKEHLHSEIMDILKTEKKEQS
ncbi:MAG: inositol monophosphatase family protein [Candidatus Competibacteraceae bacterium]